jgi:hypothetical protein
LRLLRHALQPPESILECFPDLESDERQARSVSLLQPAAPVRPPEHCHLRQGRRRAEREIRLVHNRRGGRLLVAQSVISSAIASIVILLTCFVFFSLIDGFL